MTMPTNLTDRLGELVKYADDRVEGRYQLGRFVLRHKDEILSALRKAEQPVPGYYAELVERLRKAAFWTRTGAELAVDTAPFEAATAIERLTAEVVGLRVALRHLDEKALFDSSALAREVHTTVRLSLGDEK